MKQLQALLYKEWRDQRLLAVGALGVCLVAVAIAKLLHGSHFGPLTRTGIVFPGCLGLFVLVLATEAITRDAQNGVANTLLRLPMPRSTTWLAKVGFVAVAGLSCLLLLVLVELALRTLEHSPALDGLFAMVQPTTWILIAALGSACLACACVLQRSLPAAFLGVACIAGVPLVALALPEGHARDWFDLMLCSWTPASLAALVCGAFLLGSLLAHRVRRPDALGWRRAAQAMLGVGLVLGPALANSARLGEWAFDIRPFSKSAEVRNISLSPDGRFLALNMSQMWVPRRDWLPLTGSRTGTNCRVRFEVWILDLATGSVKEVDERFRAFPMDQPWDPAGKLVTVSTPGDFGDGDYTSERIDPTTATVIDSHPQSELDSLDYAYGFERWFEKSTHDDQREFSWHGRTARLRLPREARVIPSPEPGIVFHESGNQLVRHDLADDSTRVLAHVQDLRSALLRVSPDGRYLQLGEGREERILDARDGRVVRELDKQSGLLQWSRVPGRIGIFCTRRSKYVDWQVLLADGSVSVIPTHEWGISEFGPDGLLCITRSWIECMNLDGSDHRVLYGPR